MTNKRNTKTAAASSSKNEEATTRKTVSPEQAKLAMQIVRIDVPEKEQDRFTKKHKAVEIGKQYDCIAVSVTRFNKVAARLIVDGELAFLDPKYLKAVKPIAAAKVALLKAEQDERQNATILVPAVIGNESEKAVLVEYKGWFRGVWFPKSLVTCLGDHDDGKSKIYELPLWKVATKGADSVAAIQAMQDDLLAMIGEADEKPSKKAATKK